MFSLPELQLIRAGLDSLVIKGADAKFLAQLQFKIENEIQDYSYSPSEEILQPEETSKKTK
jgi:hypothetical protein